MQILVDHCLSDELSAEQLESHSNPAKAAVEYLLTALPSVGIKPYRKLVPGLWKTLRDVIPAAGYDRPLEEAPQRRAWFWGVILRLSELQGHPPTDPAAFVQWCQLSVFREHVRRRSDQQFSDAMGGFTGQPMSSEKAREILGLPGLGVELTRKGINDAYKVLARQHYPDAGGDAVRFQQLTVARDRLLEVVVC